MRPTWIERVWYTDFHPMACLLWPFSIGFRLIANLRRVLLTRRQVSKSLPVIIVGNISVGGTGKTPCVIALIQLLQESGYRPGVISRGYGGSQRQAYVVNAVDSPAKVGDEALLIKRKTNVPVVIASDRNAALQRLTATCDCNIVISDDGLQHYAMARDIEIAIIDAEREFGNGFCLPAGPLREPISRLQQVDFVITNGKSHLSQHEMQLTQEIIKPLAGNQYQLDFDKPITAIAGIGNPQRFFNTLQNLEIHFTPKPYPDHYLYRSQDFGNDETQYLMTEKDAVKCTSFANDKMFYLPVKAEFNQEFKDLFLKKISTLIS